MPVAAGAVVLLFGSVENLLEQVLDVIGLAPYDTLNISALEGDAEPLEDFGAKGLPVVILG